MMMDGVLWVVSPSNLVEICQRFGGQKSYSENRGSRFLRNFDMFLPAYMEYIPEHTMKK